MKKYFLLLTAILTVGFAVAQGSIAITGTVTSKNSNETIVGATITVQNSNIGAATDLDGTFVIKGLTPGLYNVQCSFVGYQTKVIYEVEVSFDR